MPKEQEKTLNYYNSHADEYANLNNGNLHMNKYHMWIKEYISQGTIYDIGCGTGRDVNAFDSLGYTVKGLDYSKGMIQQAQQSFPHCQFEIFDITKDLFKNLSKVDIIWSCASLLHLKPNEFTCALHSFHSILKEKGLCFLSMKLSDITHCDMVNGRFFQYYEREELENIVNNASFTILKSDTSNRNADTFISFLLLKK